MNPQRTIQVCFWWFCVYNDTFIYEAFTLENCEHHKRKNLANSQDWFNPWAKKWQTLLLLFRRLKSKTNWKKPGGWLRGRKGNNLLFVLEAAHPYRKNENLIHIWTSNWDLLSHFCPSFLQILHHTRHLRSFYKLLLKLYALQHLFR